MNKSMRALAAALMLGACANLVGITDTEVTNAGGQASGGQGNAGPNGGNAGSSARGGSGTSGSAGSAGQNSSGGEGNTGNSGGVGADAGASSAGAPAAGAGGGGCDCPPEMPTCEGGQCTVRGPTMVPVNDFFMDSTEVTIAHYNEFLAAKGDDVSGQPAFCSWNLKYAPEPGEVSDELALPMSYVDWCDAWAFCAWADKRLCGKIGGGSLTDAEVTESTLSQWSRGCGGPNADTHPSIGGVYQTCNDNGAGLFAAGSTCEGSYAGLFDTQGNAAEWVDSCAENSGAADICLSLGGSYTGLGLDYCDEVPTEWARSDRYDPLGFRCCSK